MRDYIYIISNDLGYIKVGVSNNPERRVKQLQTGNEHKLTLLFKEEFNCTRKHLLSIEKDLHKQLRSMSTRCVGEWFFLDKYKMDSIKNTIIFYRIRYEDDTLAFRKPFR
ncbi:MAG: GIY-YIG nuclease family protein [Bacilli bacterium]|nr:GIY-YIG nuclease family protein [Bacilli bacterium]